MPWLDAHKVANAFHGYKASGIDRPTLETWATKVGWEVLLNRAGTTFRKLPDADKEAITGKKALNATVVPTASLGYLTLWPFGYQRPFVSTLNASDDAIVSNAAIVPAGTAGAIASYVTNQTRLVLDANGYFAP